MRTPRRRVRAGRRGGYDLYLPAAERALLKHLPSELAATLEAFVHSDDEAPDTLRRLFPPAYPNDARAEASYRALSRADLARAHREALDLMARTADAQHLDDAQAEAWLRALNDLRLALGSALDIKEESFDVSPADDRYNDWIYYQYLSLLQTELVDALEPSLGEPTDDSDPLEDPWGDPPGGLRWDGTNRPQNS